MALTGKAFVALVGNDLALEAHQRHHAAQEDVDLFVIGKALQHTGADEAVVCMVEHDIRAQSVHHMVEAFGSEPFEEAIGIAAAAHAVDHLCTVQILFYHLVHGVDVVLTVAVDGDGDIAGAAVQCLHQTGQHGVLMAAVTALGNADVVLVRGSKALNQLPCLIFGAVVHEQHPALLAHKALCGKAVDLFQKHGRCNGQHLLLVVAGNHDP